MDPRTAYRLQQLRHQLGGGAAACPPLAAAPARAADNAQVPIVTKVCSAEEAAELIPDGVWLTVRIEGTRYSRWVSAVSKGGTAHPAGARRLSEAGPA